MYSGSYTRDKQGDGICQQERTPIDERDVPPDDVEPQICVNDCTETDGGCRGTEHGRNCQRVCPQDVHRARAHEPQSKRIAEPVEQACMKEMARKLGRASGHEVRSLQLR